MARALVAVLAAGLLLASGCGAKEERPEARDADAGEHAAAADTGTCVKDATPATSTGTVVDAFPFPQGTVVFHVEDRGADGVIATGVTATPFDEALASMNAAEDAGFEVTTGETEEDDAEASWTGNGYVGRWAIKRSATCPGETVVQLLSKRK
jgi:hypothetical protein